MKATEPETKREFLSLHEYARSRRARGLVGGTLKSVQRAVHSGRLTLEPDGRINRAKADACCPVCVTPVEIIDKAIEIAGRPNVTFTSFGDMLRVSGSAEEFLSAKARGGDVRMVYSPMDRWRWPKRIRIAEVVFFAVGFETMAPANAMAVAEARRQRIDNFSILVAHVLVPAAMEAILSSPGRRVQGFLAAGHVCTIMGSSEYEPLAAKYHVPIVITGF
jgi:hydrogenase expression/formation protein HypD